MRRTCIDIINDNKVQIKNNNQYTRVFTSGSSIYATPWSRDFLYSAPILLKHDEWREAVGEHFYLLLLNRKGNYLPKGMDTMWFDWRIVRAFFRNITGQEPKRDPLIGDLKPYYSDSLFSNSVDTNLLFLNLAMEMYKYNNFKGFIQEIRGELMSIFKYYDNFIQNDLIIQYKFSDWKDTLERKGTTFLTNLLYWKVVKEMTDSNLFKYNLNICPDNLKQRIHETFFIPEKGIYMSILNKPYIAVDENLLAIEWNFAPDGLLDNLHKIDTLFLLTNEGYYIPYATTTPQYPLCKKSPFTVFAGAKNYHDKCNWSWIMGLYGKICYRLKKVEQANFFYDFIDHTIKRDKTVYDAYTYANTNTIKQFKSWGFKAEHDWLWGASYLLDMHEERTK